MFSLYTNKDPKKASINRANSILIDTGSLKPITLKADELKELFKDREKNRVKILCSQINYAVSLANNYCKNPKYIDDYIQEILLAINISINTFDENNGAGFSGWCNINIFKGIQKINSCLNLEPLYDATIRKRVNQIKKEFGQDLSLEEIKEKYVEIHENSPISTSKIKSSLSPHSEFSYNKMVSGKHDETEYIELMPVHDEKLESIEVKGFYFTLINICKKEYGQRWRIVYNILSDFIQNGYIQNDKYGKSYEHCRQVYEGAIVILKKYSILKTLSVNNEFINIDLKQTPDDLKLNANVNLYGTKALYKERSDNTPEINTTQKSTKKTIPNVCFNGDRNAYLIFWNFMNNHGFIKGYENLRNVADKIRYIESIKQTAEYHNRQIRAKKGSKKPIQKTVKITEFKHPEIKENIIELTDAKGYFICDQGYILHGNKKMYVNYNKSFNKYYSQISIKGKLKTFILHRTVAQYFLPNPLNMPDVLFKNGNDKDCRLNNLQWGKQDINIPTWNIETQQKGTSSTGFCQPKLNEKDVLKIYNSTDTQKNIAREYNIARTLVSLIQNGKRWSWLTKHNVNNLNIAI